MYKKHDLPLTGQLVKITNIKFKGFKDNVFGADTILKLINKQYKNESLYAVAITWDWLSISGDDDGEKTEMYFLDQNNLIIHDTCFIGADELQYVEYVEIDHPECINEFSSNIAVFTLPEKGCKIRHVNGAAYNVKTEMPNIIVSSDSNADDIKIYNVNTEIDKFYKDFKGFDTSVKYKVRNKYNFDAVDQDAFIKNLFSMVDNMLGNMNRNDKQNFPKTEAEKRRAKLYIVGDE